MTGDAGTMRDGDETIARDGRESGNDFELVGSSVWIRHGDLVVYVRGDTGGLCVDILPVGDEAGDPLDSCSALFTDLDDWRKAEPEETE